MAESGDDKELCKVDVIANLFGVSVRRVQQLTQEGIKNDLTAQLQRENASSLLDDCYVAVFSGR